MGRYGSPTSPTSRHPPSSTFAPRRRAPAGQLGEQARLANTRITGEQDHDGLALFRPLKGGNCLAELLDTAYEPRT
jgi:hypothetical protein